MGLSEEERETLWPERSSWKWRNAEALLKLTRRDEWRSWSLGRQADEIAGLAAALGDVIPSGDVGKHVEAAVERILAARADDGLRAAQAALRDAADAIQALHPGEIKNSVIFLRDRADALAETATDDEGSD